MSITAPRALVLAAGTAALTLAAMPAGAQANREAVLNILVECAKIDDPTARLACFDNNIRNAGGTARSTVPGQVSVQGGAAPVSAASTPSGFGAESVRTEQRARAASEVQNVRSRATAVAQREPGIYLVTIEDGAQWLFNDSVPLSYRPPRVGSVVDIERGSLGSFLMQIDGQRPVGVRRVR